MSVLRSIESKIEGLFEGIFGRAFRAHVQPIELARKLVKEMDEHRAVSVSRVYVPNEYTVYLSTHDRRQFSGYEGSLIGELQEYLAEHARRERYALSSSPRVLIATDDDLAVGEFGIATRLVGAEDSAGERPSAPEQPAKTMVYTTPAAAEAAPQALVESVPRNVTLTINGHVHEIRKQQLVLGRARDCDLRIGDVNVSRRHAELRQEGTTYWIVDLGSMNGTQVNGRRVERKKLDEGDRITLGSTEIVFGRPQS
jgi:hypothetical protein